MTTATNMQGVFCFSLLFVIAYKNVSPDTQKEVIKSVFFFNQNEMQLY